MLPPDDFDDGIVYEICVRYSAGPGDDIRIEANLRSASVGQGFGNIEAALEAKLAAHSKSGNIYLCQTLDCDFRFNRGDIVTLNIKHPAGESGRVLNIFGVELLYKADGPIENRPEIRSYDMPSMTAARFERYDEV